MADQIKIRRRQRKDTILNITRDNITATLNVAAAVAANSSLPYFSSLNNLLCNFLFFVQQQRRTITEKCLRSCQASTECVALFSVR